MTRKLELIDGGKCRKRRVLFRAYSSIDNWHGRDRVRFNWFYLDRQHPVLPYPYLIVDYGRLSDHEKKAAERCVRELFTRREIEALSSYLWTTHKSELYTKEVALPAPPEVCVPCMAPSVELAAMAVGEDGPSDFLAFPYGLDDEEGFYRLSEEEGYTLSFDVWAQYSLKGCPSAQEIHRES